MFIDKMRKQDILEIAAIEEISHTIPHSTVTLAEWAAENYLSYTARNSVGEIIGYLQASYIFNSCEILNIAITPHQQKQGIGSKLMQTLINACKALQIEEIFLEVAEHNLSALQLYQKFNFIKVGERKNYYLNKVTNLRENALVMRASIF